MSVEQFKKIVLNMCDLWLKTYGLNGKSHVDTVLKGLNELTEKNTVEEDGSVQNSLQQPNVVGGKEKLKKIRKKSVN